MGLDTWCVGNFADDEYDLKRSEIHFGIANPANHHFLTQSRIYTLTTLILKVEPMILVSKALNICLTKKQVQICAVNH